MAEVLTSDTTYTVHPGQEYGILATNGTWGGGSLTVDALLDSGDQEALTTPITADGQSRTFKTISPQVVVNLTTVNPVTIELRPIGRAPGS